MTGGIALMLAAMAILSWGMMIMKYSNALRLKRLTKDAECTFWLAGDFGEGLKQLSRRVSSTAHNPFLALALSGQQAALHRQARAHLHDRLRRLSSSG